MASLGTFKLTDTGVSLSQRGRGVVLNVSFKELEVWAARNKVDEKKLWERSWNRSCSTLRSQLQKVVSQAGGAYGVPRFRDFEAFTKELREVYHKSKPMGGVLASKKAIIWHKVGNTTYIGWPDRLAQWAERYQDGSPGPWGESLFTDNEKRRMLHMRGIEDVPRTYTENPRRVLPEPFGTHAQKHLEEWAKGAFYKDLARQMAKKRYA